MDGTRHQLLPGAGFPQNQNVRIGRSNHFDLLLNPPPLAPAMKRALKARKRLVSGAR